MNELKLNRISSLDQKGWYQFLLEEYFRWKYTAPNSVLGTDNEAILLKDSRKRGSIVIISLYLPSGKQSQGLMVNRDQICKKYGVDAEREFWEKIEGFQTSLQASIPVNEQFTLDDSRSLLAAMRLLLTQ